MTDSTQQHQQQEQLQAQQIPPPPSFDDDEEEDIVSARPSRSRAFNIASEDEEESITGQSAPPPRKLKVKLRRSAQATSVDPEGETADMTARSTRASTRRRSDASPGDEDEDQVDQQPSHILAAMRGTRRSGRNASRKNTQEPQSEESFNADDDAEDSDDDDEDDDAKAEDDVSDQPVRAKRTTRSGRAVKASVIDQSDDEYSDVPKRQSRPKRKNNLDGFVASDDDEEEDDDSDQDHGRSRRSAGRLTRGKQSTLEKVAEKRRAAAAAGSTRAAQLRAQERAERAERTGSEEADSNVRGLRPRQRVNYALVAPPLEPTVVRPRGRGAANGYDLDDAGVQGSPAGKRGLFSFPAPPGGRPGANPWDNMGSMTGRDYAKIFGDPGAEDSSDEDIPTARKTGAIVTSAARNATAGPGLLGAGAAPDVGGTAGLGRLRGTDALADVDPLGVDMRVTFDSVGGLDGHISQLKEMVALPLLYPELFSRFNTTPPRGVLFHGPPGTGKTLVARALAASCSAPRVDSSSGGTGAGTGEGGASSSAAPAASTERQPGEIAFFMRKGADCLSKWVGEAERQLRLLFDEARAAQPSIIFFDEIDGLAPVRSAKQDQIHASIVSTLLALMDGLDPRGQVVVIGATNRPDAIDPALRRPGRFDREFYFPLPDRDARRKILQINTKKWEKGLDEAFLDRLADVTKGYGGSDLKALCTEAALSAIQRRYPQIYSSDDRLVLDPASINVDAKDFMMSVSRMVPSSARSSTSPAAPLPEHLRPLLGDEVARAIRTFEGVLPPTKKRNALEEAKWEDVPHEALPGDLARSAGDGGFALELLQQSFEAQRLFRPRILIHGKPGMGQAYVGAALLQHSEGTHVQSLDLATLLGDAARTPDAAVVQLFSEARRHRPSVLFIPMLQGWCEAVPPSTKATIRALLDGLPADEPLLLLATAECEFQDLDREVQSWFGWSSDNKVLLTTPDDGHRHAFFSELLTHITRPPPHFPDALPRRRRELESLPLAPARAPRVKTAAEEQAQADADARTLEHLKFRLGPVLAELKKKFRRFTRDAWDEYNLKSLTEVFDSRKEKGLFVVSIRYDRPPPKKPRAKKSQNAHAPETQEEHDGQTNVEGEDFGASEAEEGSAAQADGEGAAQGEDVEASLPVFSTTAQLNQHGNERADEAMADGDAVGNAPEVEGLDPAAVNGHILEVNGVVPNGNGPLTPAAADNIGTETAPEEEAVEVNPEEPAYEIRDLTIYTMNLEKMQKRLYHNGYLTVASFLSDLGKIVANAEAAQEVDAERAFKALQMRNLASIMLEQYVEVSFRIECERMAERVVERERKEKEREVEKTAQANANAKGRRGAAGKSGDVANGATHDEQRKRGRGDSEGTGAEASKRARTVEPAPISDPHPALAKSSSQIQRKQSQPPMALAPHPPFRVPQDALHHLSSILHHTTSSWTLEQILSLRAALFATIWKHRAEWDRGSAVRECESVLRKRSAEVEMERRESEAAEGNEAVGTASPPQRQLPPQPQHPYPGAAHPPHLVRPGIPYQSPMHYGAAPYGHNPPGPGQY